MAVHAWQANEGIKTLFHENETGGDGAQLITPWVCFVFFLYSLGAPARRCARMHRHMRIHARAYAYA